MEASQIVTLDTNSIDEHLRDLRKRLHEANTEKQRREIHKMIDNWLDQRNYVEESDEAPSKDRSYS